MIVGHDEELPDEEVERAQYYCEHIIKNQPEAGPNTR